VSGDERNRKILSFVVVYAKTKGTANGNVGKIFAKLGVFYRGKVRNGTINYRLSKK
jgi:hypothetical protein